MSKTNLLLILVGLVVLAFAALVAVLLKPFGKEDASASDIGMCDKIIFGDPSSESMHGFESKNSVTGKNVLGIACRQINRDGFLEFDLQCDPVKTNYLTVKLWGSDTGDSMLFLAEVDGKPVNGAYGKDTPELDRMSKQPAYPGRFYYSTYIIPADVTSNKQKVRIKLISTGQANPYASDPSQKVGVQNAASRGIYSAAVHTNPFYVPDKDEVVKADDELKTTAKELPKITQYDYLKQQVNMAIRKIASWQNYGPLWDKRVVQGNAPSVMTGAIAFNNWSGNSTWTVQEWKDNAYPVAVSRQNNENMIALTIFAKAYLSPWSEFYKNDEMLYRVAKALDFYCIAQGSNGAFHDSDKYKKWIGGPDRKEGSSCLEGFGDKNLGKSIVMLKEYFDQKGILDELIDNDDNPETPMVTRREAYIQMLRLNRDYIVGPIGRGHAPNQDLQEILTAYWDNEALGMLSPQDAWPREKMMEYIYSATGLAPDVYGGYWFSAKGMPMEPNGSSGGGYTSEYGAICVEAICELAALCKDDKVIKKAIDAVNAFSYYMYPSVDMNGNPVIAKEQVINWRNNSTSPGTYGVNITGALELNIPAALRQAQLYLEHQRTYSVDLNTVDAHYMPNVESAMNLLDKFHELEAQEPTDYRLPFENNKDFAWADEMAATVVVKHGEVRMFMNLNWRHSPGNPRSPQNATVNNIARVHYTTPTIDRMANIVISSPKGYGQYYQARYGDYIIGMNCSKDNTYKMDIPKGLTKGLDLISGKKYDLRSEITIPPSSTIILYTGK